jgi:hypothetical protein
MKEGGFVPPLFLLGAALASEVSPTVGGSTNLHRRSANCGLESLLSF